MRRELVQLTDWSKEPSVSDLQQNLDDAEIEHNRHIADVDRWQDNLTMTGRARPKKIQGRSSVAPKVIRKQGEWRYSSVAMPFLSTPDVFNVRPVTAGDRLRAQQNALVLNHQFNTKIAKVAFIDAYVRDAVDLGTVIVEVGWNTKEEVIDEEVPTYAYTVSLDPSLAQQYTNLLMLRQANQDLYEQHMNPGLDYAISVYAQTGQTLQPQQTGFETRKKRIETHNHPTVDVCDPNNVIIDPSCSGDMNKARFVIRRHKSSLDELRKSGKYKNLDHLLIESSDPGTDPDYVESKDLESFTFKDEPRKQFVIHTYWGDWDIHGTGTTVPIVASWVGRVLIRMEENPFPFKRPPFVKAVYMPVRKSIYGESDGELLEENQQIIGAVTRGMIDLMGRSANSQTGTKQGFLDATNKRKFARGEDYVFNGQGRPEESVYMHKYPEIPRSAFEMIQSQNADAESLTGVKAFSSGINAAAMGASVGGGRDAMDAASKRESGILLRLAEGIKDIGRMFISMNAEFLSEEEVVRITNEKFVTVRRDDLSGSFDLELSISTAEEDNKKAEELAFMLQTTGNNMDPGLRNMILSDIARLRKMPDMAKRIEEYKPEPDPMVIKKAELEIVLLEAQIAKENALAAKHSTEANANQHRGFKDNSQALLNTAKTGTEQAKSRNLNSDSDNKDINYLETHQGLPHQRELEKEQLRADNKKQESNQ